ncbi:uncharacterized protein NECHADRAFT_89366 [Fusarium vanettenii 77-13-4]|uniref:L-asparaginase N-terminal domain-containing protein n=1 Tax=Fusarium vanettenii (strain ATCC MYA-4622 / CBS 123669 / FGSC 9596 / NRRL 45880 / 77-13-4) TaxID=660122 RepID=C7ZQZ8_FUSV7|nr:uncharacterized protein NECHADRAFT_89366 [Fusarium vanettenii 77-13-4]EEU33561.1 hypothetical protein NECHADRAFT_89366 [Fusarium vanettenii 77-13-4]
MFPRTVGRSIIDIGTGGTALAMGTSKKYNNNIDKTDRDHKELAPNVQDQLRDENVYGMVVTHETDTLPELAAFMSFTLQSEKPAVITDAIRPSTERTADGFANLQDGLVVAQQGHKYWCMVVFQQKILSGMYVFKSDFKSLDAFSAAKPGQLGFVDSHTVYFFHPPAAQIGPPMHFRASFEAPDMETVTGLPADGP